MNRESSQLTGLRHSRRMLRLFIRGHNDLVGNHLPEHLLQWSVTVQSGKIQAYRLHFFYPQGRKKPLRQATSGGEREAAKNEHSRDAGYPGRAPPSRKESPKEGDALLSGAVLAFEPCQGNLRINRRFKRSGVKGQQAFLNAPSGRGDFLEVSPALRTIRHMIFDFRTLDRIQFTIAICAQRTFTQTIHSPSSRP